MVKYPLSKEPINADKSAEGLKNTQDKMKKAFDELKNAGMSIQSDLEGQEFELAAAHIGKMLQKINNSSAKINQILQTLTKEVNEYNSQIVDADGNPYGCKKVNYTGDNPSSNDFLPVGGNYTSDSQEEKIFDKYQFNVNHSYEADSILVYNNQKYSWNEVSNKFLTEIGYNKIISNIAINKNIATCYLNNGGNFIVNNVNDFENLKNGILEYFSKKYM